LIVFLNLLGCFFKSCVRDETDRGMKSFCLTQYVERESDSVALELAIDTIKGVFKGDPKIDFL
jgi:hypothetical protein